VNIARVGRDDEVSAERDAEHRRDATSDEHARVERRATVDPRRRREVVGVHLVKEVVVVREVTPHRFGAELRVEHRSLLGARR
jgi:hypothetical protein